MKIKVNGKEKNIRIESDKALLSSTLELLGYRPNTIVVELNAAMLAFLVENPAVAIVVNEWQRESNKVIPSNFNINVFW